MVRVLVSVKNVEEAKIALKAGVDLIDLKDPIKAPMGMIDLPLILQIQNAMPKNINFSMACGELCDMQNLGDFLPVGMSFYKFGLSNCKSSGDWVNHLLSLKKKVVRLNNSAFVVPVLYGDYLKANSIKPSEVLKYLCEHFLYAIMIDTWGKDGSSMLDFATMEELLEIQELCKARNIKFALAGSLNLHHAETLIKEGVRPAWFGFRGAVCNQQSRNNTIDFDLTFNLVAGIKRLNNL